MKATRGYREYNAWLQPCAAADLPPVRVEAPPEASFVRGECERAWQRLTRRGSAAGSGAACVVRLAFDADVLPEGYRVRGADTGATVTASDTSGLLYGVYALTDSLRLGGRLADIDIARAPRVARRVLNHWDNMDGSVERGYSGRSLFFSGGDMRYDAGRVTDYARLLASIGVNAVCPNGVNVTARGAQLLTPALLPDLAGLADLFRPFGVRLIVAVDFESPVVLGGLPTADPLDRAVAAWWRETADTVYAAIPDLAGFLIKADSEFRAGPSDLGRTHADGANVIARALAPHGGDVYWRCFVYNCRQDWRDTRTDRPRAAYDHFFPLDGLFDANVILQIKQGPSDFQVREPNSPLLGAMVQTREALELQIAQEYTGQQIDLYALAVQWQEILDTPVSPERTTRDLVGEEIDAFVAVSNVGDDPNWTGHTLAQANLFAFGRMAWDPGRTAADVLAEWAGLTFGTNPALTEPLVDMLLASRGTYEKYTAPLGIGWMVNVGHHYGPSVDGYEYMPWGTYHRADQHAIGVDRTPAGTGFTRQYHPWLAERYESLDTCPEPLLLFFHRLPYGHRLSSGETLLQHIYDTHFEGAAEVEALIAQWCRLRPLLPRAAYVSVLQRLRRQLENAREWRDVVNTYFFRKTGISDRHGRLIHV